MVSQAFLLDPFGNQVYVFLYIPTWHQGLVYPGLPPLKCDDTSIPAKTWIIMESALREQVGTLPKNQGINTG